MPLCLLTVTLQRLNRNNKARVNRKIRLCNIILCTEYKSGDSWFIQDVTRHSQPNETGSI